MIVRELLTRLGIKVDDKGFKKADKSIKNTIGGLKGLVGALVGGFVVRGIGRFITSQIDLADNIGKTATQLGIGVEALQEFRFAADLAGVEAAKFDQALALLQKNAFDAATGSKEFADDFKKLGISVKDTNGQLKDGPTLILEMADGIAALDNESEKVAIALSLMGRSGRQLLPLFTNGAKGIEEMRKEAQELGFILGEEDVRAAEDAKDELTRFGRVVQGMKNQVFLAVLPSIINFTRGLINLGKGFVTFLRDTGLVKVGLLLLGAAALGAGAAMLIAFAGPLLVAAQAALVFLAFAIVLDEILTLFAGGESVVGLFIDKIFGLGAADEFVKNHRAGVEQMAKSWRNADGDIVGFASSLFDLQFGIRDVGDVFRDLGALWFDVTKELKALTLDAIATMLEAFAKVPGAGKLFGGAAKLARQQAADTRLGVRTTQGRGTGAPIQIRGRARRQNTIERFRERQAQAAARAEGREAVARGEAGLKALQGRRGKAAKAARAQIRKEIARVEKDAGLTTTGRATGRGTGAGAETIRFGRAQAPRGSGGTVTQDNRINFAINGEGLSPEAIFEQIQRLVTARDEDNRRKAIGALAQTGEAG